MFGLCERESILQFDITTAIVNTDWKLYASMRRYEEEERLWYIKLRISGVFQGIRSFMTNFFSLLSKNIFILRKYRAIMRTVGCETKTF